mgnify:CR=1 FL=1
MIKKTLYFGNPAYLSLRNAQLVIRKSKVEADVDEQTRSEVERTIAIEDIGMVVLDHRQITITSGAMSALLETNVAVVSCNNQSMPIGMMLPLASNSIQSERFRHQIDASLPLRKQLWAQTVRQKIINQQSVLAQNTSIETRCMRVWANAVKSGDPENQEGRAAAYYWHHLFPDIPNFVRGREEEPPNNLLNYGYAILRAVIARSLVASGLLPTLGIHHHNRYNAYCLADDIMEPYRPFVDATVIRIMQKYRLFSVLTLQIKAELLQIPVLDVMIEGKRSPLMVAAGITAASLARCYRGDIRQISYPYME